MKCSYLFILPFIIGCQALTAAIYYDENNLDISLDCSYAFSEELKNVDITRKVNEHKKSRSYPYNPAVPRETWEQLKPFFLPFDHPIKKNLDKIFSSRVTLNKETFVDAGFDTNGPKHPENLIVGTHPLLRGYVLKVYLDVQNMNECDNFYRRITGARSIQKSITAHGYQHLFKVPQKWIYPLPKNTIPPNNPELYPKHFILVAEDMHILSHHRNGKCFKKKITPEILDALYTVITELGLIDSVFKGNIPFNEAGQLNFIDTEHHHKWPIKYYQVHRFINQKMQQHWQQLIDSGDQSKVAHQPAS